MTTPNLVGASSQSPAADLGFYFQGDIQRRLETSKPIRRTRVDGTTKKSADDGKQQQQQQLKEADEPQTLYKWQREQQQEDEGEEGETVQVSSTLTGASAKWNVITGNVPPSELSIGAYFENDGTQGKSVRDCEEGILVNAGGVILLQPSFGKGGSSGEKGARPGIFVDETNKAHGDGFSSDDLLLRATLEDDRERNPTQVKEPQERLWFKHSSSVWPPEAPAFPPPPPSLAETVPFKRVPKGPNQIVMVKRLSRVRPDLAAQRDILGSRDVREAALINTPQYAAAMAGGASRGVQDMVGRAAAAHNNNGEDVVAHLPPTRPDGSTTTMSRQRAPSSQASSVTASTSNASKKGGGGGGGGLLRRLSFMPTLGGKAEAAHTFQGVYAVNMQIPYILPPPPEPRKPPPVGSNAERQQQRFCIKKLFLEDQYSTLIELADELLRIKDSCRELEATITANDIQINTLLSSNE